MTSDDKPQAVTGGCLCQNVRYTITFPSDWDWDNAGTTTCQCSQCRRSTGTLYMQSFTVALAMLRWDADGSSPSSLASFSATPRHPRSFCRNCGSFLAWRSEDGDRVSVAVGSLDTEVLRRWGGLLAVPKRQLWCDEEIPGATDHLQGERWRFDCLGEGVERMP